MTPTPRVALSPLGQTDPFVHRLCQLERDRQNRKLIFDRLGEHLPTGGARGPGSPSSPTSTPRDTPRPATVLERAGRGLRRSLLAQFRRY